MVRNRSHAARLASTLLIPTLTCPVSITVRVFDRPTWLFPLLLPAVKRNALRGAAARAAEPTSGLDSTTAMHVLEILRGLATGGRAVLTTIHQVHALCLIPYINANAVHCWVRRKRVG